MVALLVLNWLWFSWFCIYKFWKLQIWKTHRKNLLVITCPWLPEGTRVIRICRPPFWTATSERRGSNNQKKMKVFGREYEMYGDVLRSACSSKQGSGGGWSLVERLSRLQQQLHRQVGGRCCLGFGLSWVAGMTIWTLLMSVWLISPK